MGALPRSSRMLSPIIGCDCVPQARPTMVMTTGGMVGMQGGVYMAAPPVYYGAPQPQYAVASAGTVPLRARAAASGMPLPASRPDASAKRRGVLHVCFPSSSSPAAPMYLAQNPMPAPGTPISDVGRGAKGQGVP